MEINADQLVSKGREGSISIGDGGGAILRVRVPVAPDPQARRQLLELARIATVAANEADPTSSPVEIPADQLRTSREAGDVLAIGTADGAIIRIRPAAPEQSITGSTQLRRLADLTDQASAHGKKSAASAGRSGPGVHG